MPVPAQSAISVRIAEAVSKIASVLRAENWAAAVPEGLNPAQADILQLVARRSGGVRQSWIARQLGVSAASTSDSVSALARKGYVDRTHDADDGRVTIVRVTSEGNGALGRMRATPSVVSDVLDAATDAEQSTILAMLLVLIGRMQAMGRFPETRTCVSCIHFGARAGSHAQHLCRLLDMPLPAERLRIDCPEHEMLPVHSIQRNVDSLTD